MPVKHYPTSRQRPDPDDLRVVFMRTLGVAFYLEGSIAQVQKLRGVSVNNGFIYLNFGDIVACVTRLSRREGDIYRFSGWYYGFPFMDQENLKYDVVNMGMLLWGVSICRIPARPT